MQNTNKFSVVICCAGKSSRFGTGEKKEYLPLKTFSDDTSLDDSISVLSENVYKFLQLQGLQCIVIAIPNGDSKKVKKLLEDDKRTIKACNFIRKKEFTTNNYDRSYNLKSGRVNIFFVKGGKTRQSSVFNALKFLNISYDYENDLAVLIHDAARPFFSLNLAKNILTALKKNTAVIPGIKVVDTQKTVSTKNLVTKNLVRDSLRAIQTPQGFYLKEIYEAYLKVDKNLTYTDDSEIFFSNFPKKQILVIEGELQNKKITYATDRISNQERLPLNFGLRIGLGYDIHKLADGKKLIIGGVHIKSKKGFVAHSDGDVLLHAITDALLGAVGFSDIGELFPPSDNQYKSANSKELLQKAWAKCSEGKNLKIQNIDCVLIMEFPKILPYRNAIRKSISEILQIDISKVFLKAKTAEGLGPIGKSEAIEAIVTVLVQV